MDNWSLNDSVEVNGLMDNMQLLWKLQSLDSIVSNEDNTTSQSLKDLDQSTSANLPDDDELVDKLFRESFALQGKYTHFKQSAILSESYRNGTATAAATATASTTT